MEKKVMKKFIQIISVALALLSVASCSEKNDDKVVAPICGEWHLNSTDEAVDVYLAFNGDYTFELYQWVEGAGDYYELRTGNFVFDGKTLSGTYSDGSTWRYSWSVEYTDDSLTMTRVGESTQPDVFVREKIPFQIRSIADKKTKSFEVSTEAYL
jgi:hypothetical protein